MEWMRKYWPMLVMAFGLMSTSIASQVQTTSNASDIEEIKEDVEKLQEQKTKQAIIENNQKHMRDSLKEIKELIKELKK